MLRDAPKNTVIGDKVQTIQVALTAFNHELEQHYSSIGAPLVKCWYLRIPRKLTCALYVSKEPEKLQTRMLVPLSTNNKRFVLHIWYILRCYEST